MKQDTTINRRQFMAAGAGLGLYALLPNMGHGGRSWSGREVLNPELTCIAQIKTVQTFVHVCGEIEVHAMCRAIDCCMGTFDLRLHFHPATCPVKSDQVIRDLKIDSIYWVRGEWTLGDEEIPMTIYDPEYRLYQPVDLSEQYSVAELTKLLRDDRSTS